MKTNSETMTRERVEQSLREYFGQSLRTLHVKESVLCIHATVCYNNFKTEYTVRRELMELLPMVRIELERGYTDEVMLDAIYCADLEDKTIYVSGIGGVLKPTTLHEFLIEYLDNRELEQVKPIV